MAKDTYRTSFDIPLRFKAYLDDLNYGERRLVIEKLLGLMDRPNSSKYSMTDLLLSERLLLIEKETT